jgi:hypothetical protein
VAYFQNNAASLMAIPWERGAELTAAEQSAIAASVQGFQLGESSEGRHLLRCAQDYARRTGDADYLAAVRLFIGEEQRHGRDLGRFLQLAGIPRLQRTWSDSVFRWLRRQAGLELSTSVLIAAEVIALVYYQALRTATGSAVLRRVCDQLLADEVAHIRFQTERLALLRRDRSRWQTALTNSLHRFLFAGTCLVVWWGHSSAYCAGGYGFGRFWWESWREMERAVRMMDPIPYTLVSREEPEPATA